MISWHDKQHREKDIVDDLDNQEYSEGEIV